MEEDSIHLFEAAHVVYQSGTYSVSKELNSPGLNLRPPRPILLATYSVTDYFLSELNLDAIPSTAVTFIGYWISLHLSWLFDGLPTMSRFSPLEGSWLLLSPEGIPIHEVLFWY